MYDHRRKNKISVVTNFKRMLNEVLVDLYPYPMQTIYYIFNKIGVGKKYFASLNLCNGYW